MNRVIGIVAAGALVLATAACNNTDSASGGKPAEVRFTQSAAAGPAEETTTPASDSTTTVPPETTSTTAPATTVPPKPSTPMPAPAPAPAPTGPRCDEGHWPVTVDGRPQSFSPGSAAGYYIWHGVDGWHLRTTTPSPERHVFSGTITSTDNMKVVHEFKDEPADEVTTHGNVIFFRFDTHDHIDGVDFIVGCTESVTFDLAGEGHQWPADRIALGSTGRANADPFTVSRIR